MSSTPPFLIGVSGDPLEDKSWGAEPPLQGINSWALAYSGGVAGSGVLLQQPLDAPNPFGSPGPPLSEISIGSGGAGASSSNDHAVHFLAGSARAACSMLSGGARNANPAVDGAGQARSPSGFAVASQVGVPPAVLERLFRAGGLHHFEQPVWMVINLEVGEGDGEGRAMQAWVRERGKHGRLDVGVC
jgi:hypothetical protein